MGEDALAATRLAVEAQRRELELTSDQLRDVLNLKKRFQENPVPFVAVGATAAFLLAGGPVRVARLVRRRLFRTDPEKAYDALPKPMQSWVDHMAGAVGPKAAEAREALARELLMWRHDPRKHGKVSKKLAKQIAEGPPGPQRAAWNAFEAAAAILTAAMARKVVERFLSGEPPTGKAGKDARSTLMGAAEPKPEHMKTDVTRTVVERRRAAVADAQQSGYSGMTSRDRS